MRVRFMSALFIFLFLVFNIQGQESGTRRLFGWEAGDGLIYNDDEQSWYPPSGYTAPIAGIVNEDASEGVMSRKFCAASDHWITGLLRNHQLGWNVLYRNPNMLRTSGWHNTIFGNDWSDYPKLWVDVL